MRDAALASIAAAAPRMLADVRAGLSLPQKELPPTYFYDARGSALFDEITRLPEYYLTRREHALLVRHARAIAAAARPRTIAELGAGTATKSRILIRAAREAGYGGCYAPIDVSAATLAETAAALSREFPSLDVRPVAADLREDVGVDAAVPRPLLYAFLGSTIGNFAPPAARGLLGRIHTAVAASDRLLLGVDLVKDVAVLEAAYDDARGVTAEFNRNVLRVLNSELGADFDVDAFAHRALYDGARRRIEMHLVAKRAQRVRIPGIGIVAFRAGESIRTEISCKYDRATVRALLEASGWRLDAWLADEDAWFALVTARPAA